MWGISVSKIIAYQRGLEEMAQELEFQGFEVTEIAAASNGYDVLLYDSENAPISLSSLPKPNNNGALIINARGKSVENIVETIGMRSYSKIL